MPKDMKENTPIEKQIDILADYLMKEFEEPKSDGGAIEVAMRLLNEYKYRDGVIGKSPDGEILPTNNP